ncbi:hypothetical protein GIB67_017970 [Kingdonia uniflora]|uniref:DYW domain-containing protein n=1 Tax=Kingdonia uniflora TaxID=39325 RepID=A0A7J7MIN5_9MAGN|nr:hypothetical protein GIB67_017970 [Kingdonia uniflora]
MASLPSVAVPGTIKLDLDFKKSSQTSLSTHKNSSIFNAKTDPRCLDFREALSMIEEGSKVETAFYVPILQECIDRNSVSEAQIIHTHIIKTGSYEDSFLTTFLVNVYAKCGEMGYARKVFENFPQRNIVTWTTLMTGYVYNSMPELAIKVFQEMLESGVYPTNYTIGAVISACSFMSSIRFGKQIHGYIIKYKLDCDTSTGNALCSFYSKCGKFGAAVKAFRRIKEKNVISWTTAISACGDNGRANMGLKLFVEMLSEDAGPNDFTLTSILSLCCLLHAVGFGEQVHSFSIKLGFEPNILIRTSFMYLYLKCGRIDESRRLFDGIEDISLVTWNAMIAGYAQMTDHAKDSLMAHHSGTEALNIFLRLMRSNMKPDLYTFSSVLTVCSSLIALEQGEQVHAQTIKTGFLSDVVVGSSLVNMYNKCGSIERATKAFVEMPTRTLISWTSMITGFSQHGRTRQALDLFEDMRLAGVRPNKITFVGVLSACSHAGKVDEAMRYFEMMKKQYGIKPMMDHYSCLIDMYVRLGRLKEAFELIEKMDIEPNEFVWSLLIAGCRSLKNMELGFYAAERLLELKPKDTEAYALLLNMYLAEGRWNDVSRVRKLMREEGRGKLMDWSSINIKDKVYSFKPDGRSHHQSAEIYALLEDLLEKAKSLGYVSLRCLEMDDEDVVKEKTVSSTVHHSEKLAVAFGLLNVSSGAPIRVIKSISMCRDCHSIIKFISELTGREIIIRDSRRLHQFNNGHCSCGDFSNLL